jgi:hypothetical protein
MVNFNGLTCITLNRQERHSGSGKSTVVCEKISLGRPRKPSASFQA